jgi:hypothetical protein
MTTLEMEIFWRNLRRLGLKVPIWPEPDDLLVEGAKLLTYEANRASAAVFGEPYPNVIIEPEPTEELVAEIQTGVKKCVLKRDFSDCGDHVFRLGMPSAVEIFRKAREREGSVYNDGQSTFPQPTWFLQPYMPGFVHLGEIRAFFVNGALFNAFATTPGGSKKLEVGPLVVARPSNLFKCVSVPYKVVCLRLISYQPR